MTRRRGGTLPVGSTYTAPTAAVRFAVIRRPVPVSARSGAAGRVPQQDQEAAVRGAGVSRRPGTRPACRAPPGPARGGPRPTRGPPSADRHTAQPEAEPRPRVTRTYPRPARRYRGVSRARARAPDRPSARVRTLSALQYRRRRCILQSPQSQRERAPCGIAVYTDLYARHCFRSNSARALKAVNGGAMRAHARRHT